VEYLGIDWSYRRAAWCSLSEAGGIVGEGAVPADADGLARLVIERGVDVRAVVEMMSGAIWVRDQLAAAGWRVQVAHARKVRDVAPRACKTDKVDARVLAELARRDLVPELWIASLDDRALRERLRRRTHLVRMRASAMNRIFGLLTQWGLRMSLRVLAVAAQAHMALRQHVRELEALARTDALTGVANRRAGEEALDRALALADRRDAPLSVVMLDLDHFKAYNDRRGHGAGDLLLQRTARAWRHELRASDLLARWGGEEFLAVLPDCSLADAAVVVAERLRAAVPAPATCSAGVARRAPAEPRDDLLRRADRALYAAKGEGRDRVAVY
jgi:diguanylate cyclase (GGDEF)-like protein